MPKSTFNDCHAIYRQTTTLSHAHRLTLWGWLGEDLAQKPAKVSKERKKKEKEEVKQT